MEANESKKNQERGFILRRDVMCLASPLLIQSVSPEARGSPMILNVKERNRSGWRFSYIVPRYRNQNGTARLRCMDDGVKAGGDSDSHKG